jgi:hypothetical protein
LVVARPTYDVTPRVQFIQCNVRAMTDLAYFRHFANPRAGFARFPGGAAQMLREIGV